MTQKEFMTLKELKIKYDNLVGRIEKERIYDGRDKGVDVYTCGKCGATKYTRYKDKGVTPFTIGCKCGCTMVLSLHKFIIQSNNTFRNFIHLRNVTRYFLIQTV